MLYQLDSHYKTRCPRCGHAKRFSPYVDTVTRRPLDSSECGRCDRVNSCGYHLPPRQWRQRHPERSISIVRHYKKPNTDWVRRLFQWHSQAMVQPIVSPTTTTTIANTGIPAVDHIDRVVFDDSLSKPLTDNSLYRYMLRLFNHFPQGREAVDRVFREYGVGTSEKWGGSPVFWLRDDDGNVCDGKVMGYDDTTGKRVKTPSAQITWMSYLLSKTDGKVRKNVRRPMFGQHLRQRYPHSTLVVVESEKTALVLATLIVLYTPDAGLHLNLPVATGSLTNLGIDREKTFGDHCQASQRSRVLLVPDRGGLSEWRRKMAEMQRNNSHLRVFITPYMEKITDEWNDVPDGADIEDVISRYISIQKTRFNPGIFLHDVLRKYLE